MPFDSNGNYSLPTSYFVENGDTVLPIQHNPPFEDVAQALSATLLRDGRSPMEGDLNMATHKIANLAAATATGDAVNKGQMDTGLAAKVAKAGDTMTGNLHVGAAHLYTDGNIDGGSTLTMTAPAATPAVMRIKAPFGQPAIADFGPNGVSVYYWRIAALADSNFDFIRDGVLGYRFNGTGIWTAGYGWLNDRFADRGGRVNHDSGVWEFGSVDPNYNNRTADAPAPYVVVGLRSSVGTNVLNLRAVLLRNN